MKVNEEQKPREARDIRVNELPAFDPNRKLNTTNLVGQG